MEARIPPQPAESLDIENEQSKILLLLMVLSSKLTATKDDSAGPILPHAFLGSSVFAESEPTSRFAFEPSLMTL